MADTFTCDLCGRVEDKGPVEKADAEALAVWGVEDASQRDDMAVVCDACWQTIHPAKHPGRWDESLRELRGGG